MQALLSGFQDPGFTHGCLSSLPTCLPLGWESLSHSYITSLVDIHAQPCMGRCPLVGWRRQVGLCWACTGRACLHSLRGLTACLGGASLGPLQGHLPLTAAPACLPPSGEPTPAHTWAFSPATSPTTSPAWRVGAWVCLLPPSCSLPLSRFSAACRTCRPATCLCLLQGFETVSGRSAAASCSLP